MAECTDASLSPRARTLALWLCDLTNPAFDARNRDASRDMLLADLPDTWNAARLDEASRDIRQQIGPKASHRAWLSTMGWLVGEEERLPPRPSQRMTDGERFAARRALRTILAQLTSRREDW